MNWCRFLLLCVVNLRAAQCAGVLRLRILNLQNLEGRNINGKCCEKDDRSLLGVCRGSCHTLLRLCATKVGRHTQVDHSYSRNARQPPLAASWRLVAFNGTEIRDKPIFGGPSPELTKEGVGADNETQLTSEYIQSRAVPTPACTIGSVITPPIFNNSLDPTVEGILDVAFPFNSSWSGKFMFIIEGWHARNGHFNASQSSTQKSEWKDSPVLVARFKRIHYPTQIGKWSAAFAFSPHVKVDYAFRLDCEDLFGGPNCSQACLNVQDGNGHFTCTPQGEVECLPGWTGDVCNVPVCKKGCHPQFGYCNKPDECRCKIGYSGELCDKCAVLPGCQHGSCNNSFECNCHEGWDGLFCNQPICKEGCHSIRGFCDKPGECKCRFGWSGEMCESCQTMPGCKNGYCKKPLDCKCHEGWTGLFCQTAICKSTCNMDRGYCENPGECRCHVGWWGADCNECFPYPGCVHGTCQKPWECNCEPGWSGMLCDQVVPFCDAYPDTCMNGGVCESLSPEAGNFTCKCRGDFEGRQCEKNKSWPVTNRTEVKEKITLVNTVSENEGESNTTEVQESSENDVTTSYDYDYSTETTEVVNRSGSDPLLESEETVQTTLSARRKNNRIALLHY